MADQSAISDALNSMAAAAGVGRAEVVDLLVLHADMIGAVLRKQIEQQRPTASRAPKTPPTASLADLTESERALHADLVRTYGAGSEQRMLGRIVASRKKRDDRRLRQAARNAATITRQMRAAARSRRD